MSKKVKCPQCKKMTEYSSENDFRPFCCERCQLIDLGGWASGEFALPSDEPLSELDIDTITRTIEGEDDDRFH